MEVNFRPNLVSSWLGWITPATELENELSSPALALFPLSLRLATSGRLLLCLNQHFILQSPLGSANIFSNGGVKAGLKIPQKSGVWGKKNDSRIMWPKLDRIWVME